jgi:UDPglucose 6-dehydrogenase
MKVAVIGTGYVGLVAGTCFAHAGNQVTCVDIDAEKVRRLTEGHVPIYEPGLDELVHESRDAGRLSFTTDTAAAVRDAAVVFIAVGTPEGADGSADLRFVLGVAETIGPLLEDFTVVVMKSTVPIGTNDQVRAILERTASAEFEVVSNPEFLREGVAIQDFLHPDRVVIGTRSHRARALMTQLYRPFVESDEQIHIMDVRSAEMTKYAANCMLATRISFMNEIANLCDEVGADVDAVKRGIGTDHRIGPAFLNAGIGYGGSCFPKDVKALLHTGTSAGLPMRVLNAVEDVNAEQKGLLARRVLQRLGADLGGKVIGMLGLAFKPETDDMREAPSLTLARDLTRAGATVQAFDPVANDTAARALGETPVTMTGSWQEALAGVDAILLVTEWGAFRSLSPEEIAAATDCRLVFDGRNAWDDEEMAAAGFEYHGIGRGAGRDR